jgi:hypothetical protein
MPQGKIAVSIKKIDVLQEFLKKLVDIAVENNHIEVANFLSENASKIVGTRNRIIHGYDNVSDDLVWSIVINHLPKLKNEIISKLKE